MHPFRYETTMRYQQLEVERAIRSHPFYEGAWSAPPASERPASRIVELWRRLREAIAAPKLRPAQADRGGF